jgi:hypothetical protein
MKKNTVLTMFLLALSLLTINCSKKDGITTPTTPPNYDGSWSGVTSQGKPFSFTVSEGAVTNIYIGYSVTGNCSPVPIASQLYSRYAINGNSFSTTGNMNISGTFSSADKAGGSFTLNFTGNPSGCSSTASGTWSATK